ncbi:MAG: lipase family protein [Candidatus Kariarchaeaceae archaeon]|jgi:predicted lipase
MAKFNLENAKLLIEFAIRAYQDENELNLDELGFELVKFLNNDKTDTQGFICKDESRLIIAFRGTTSLRDAWTDVQISKKIFPRLGFFRRVFSIRSILKAKAHEGFFRSYLSIREELMELVNSQLKEKEYDIYLTGHSLGGSLATIAALDFARETKMNITNYTFGAPKVGNKRFVKYYNKKVKDTYRVVNDEDPIPSIPGFSFKHVKNGVLIDEKTTIKINPGLLERMEKGLESVWNAVTMQTVQEHSSHNYKLLLNGIIEIKG